MHDDRFDGLARRFGTTLGRRTFAGSGVLLALGVRPAAALAAPARDDEPAVTPRAAEVEAKCRVYSKGKVRRYIKKAAKKYKQPYKKMLCVAMCESSLNNCAVNRAGKTYGLFQYLNDTWKRTPYRKKDMFHPKWNALATGWMWSQGNQNEWDCCCPKFKCRCPGKTPSWCRKK